MRSTRDFHSPVASTPALRRALCGLWTMLALGLCVETGRAQTSRPTDDGSPTQVEVVVFLLDVDAVDSVSQAFTANVYYEATWVDRRLAHEGDAPMYRSLEEIWDPHLQLVNQQRLVRTFPERASVSPDGTVVYKQRVWGNFSQQLDLHDFPFDSHEFSITLATPEHSPEQVGLRQSSARASGLGRNYSLPDWDIGEWGTFPEPFSDHGRVVYAGFVFRFEANRHSGYYVWKVLLPLFLVVAMSWIVFWVDPSQMGTQISVATTSMLTLIAYRFMVGGDLPGSRT